MKKIELTGSLLILIRMVAFTQATWIRYIQQ